MEDTRYSELIADTTQYDISSWAYIKHVPTMVFGGSYEAYDKETHEKLGYLSYLRVPEGNLLIRHMQTEEAHQHRGVASALLRAMHLDNPGAKINPGSRNADGQRFYHYVNRKVPELFEEFLVSNIPLQCQDPVEYWAQAYEDGVIV